MSFFYGGFIEDVEFVPNVKGCRFGEGVHMEVLLGELSWKWQSHRCAIYPPYDFDDETKLLQIEMAIGAKTNVEPGKAFENHQASRSIDFRSGKTSDRQLIFIDGYCVRDNSFITLKYRDPPRDVSVTKL